MLARNVTASQKRMRWRNSILPNSSKRVSVAVFLVFFALVIGARSAAVGKQATAAAVQDPAVLYTETRTSPSTFRDRGSSYAPTYLIYADRQRSGDEAKKLIDDLGMVQHLEEYKARAFVVGPANGMAYDPAADLSVFQNLLRTRRSSNLKVIGVGAGATFVNNVISKYAFAVAGILTYGGSVDGGHLVVDARAHLRPCDGPSGRQAVHRSERCDRQSRRHRPPTLPTRIQDPTRVCSASS